MKKQKVSVDTPLEPGSKSALIGQMSQLNLQSIMSEENGLEVAFSMLLVVFYEDGDLRSIPTVAGTDRRMFPAVAQVLRSLADSLDAGDVDDTVDFSVEGVPGAVKSGGN